MIKNKIMNKDNLHATLESMPNVSYIKDEIYFIESLSGFNLDNNSHKIEDTVTCICMKGEMRGQINLLPVTTSSPGFLVILPNQLFELESCSADFQGIFIVMSKQFIESISLSEGFSTFMSIVNKPFMPINNEILEGVLDYCKIVKRVLQNAEEDFNRRIVVNHLTIAFFYGLGYFLHKHTADDKQSRDKEITEKFFKLVEKNYEQERSLSFYADKLCITSKYLSVVVKNSSKKSARQWINDYIILETKRLLNSTNMTIQQISDELNFPSQSFFGKFFKRNTGLSPKEFRDKK